MSHRSEMIRDGVLSAPPTIVASMTLAGVTLENWVLILSIFWLSLQITSFVYNKLKLFMSNKDKDECDVTTIDESQE